MNYDTLLFIEIVESISGIIPLGVSTEGDVTVNKYQGLTGRSVFIDVTDEEITPEIGASLLVKLGVAYLITSLFPSMVDLFKDEIANCKLP